MNKKFCTKETLLYPMLSGFLVFTTHLSKELGLLFSMNRLHFDLLCIICLMILLFISSFKQSIHAPFHVSITSSTSVARCLAC